MKQTTDFRNRVLGIVLLCLGCLFTSAALSVQSVRLPDGTTVTVDPDYDDGSIPDVGMITMTADNGYIVLKGSTANDRVGSGGITVVGESGWVVHSPLWDNGTAVDAGAVTSLPKLSFYVDVVSQDNSLVGTATNDNIGSGGIVASLSGWFVVLSPLWNNGSAIDAGAVSVGYIPYWDYDWYPRNVPGGPVSAFNSIIGTTAGDQVGSGGVTDLGDEFGISSPLWDNGSAIDAGAVSWGTRWNVSTGSIAGPISAETALLGTTANDQIGSGGIIITGLGRAVVSSPLWDNGATVDAGAVTGNFRPTGAVSVSNSLVGTSPNDRIGSGGIIPMPRGGGDYFKMFLICSPQWDNAGVPDVGAVTCSNNGDNLTGSVAPTNSLVGMTANDQAGSGGVTIIGGINFLEAYYVVRSPLWDHGSAADAGAVTCGWIQAPSFGPISVANSLVGSSAGDQVGSGVIINARLGLLGHGYVVCSPLWDNGMVVDAGAVTSVPVHYGALLTGVISPLNSLVGGLPNDQIGSGGVFMVINFADNARFMVRSPKWDHDVARDAGAVTFAPFLSGPVGLVSASNSLVGSHPGDQVGNGQLTYSNGNFTLDTPNWCYGAGATTSGPRSTWELQGVVSAANSVVGSEYEVPGLLVSQPADLELASGASRDFGTLEAGGTASLAFVIKNTGRDDLLLSGTPQVLLGGADAPLFTVISQPPRLIVTGGQASFTVQFAPTSGGSKGAALSIPNNDADESAFAVFLQGMATQHISNWRQTYFGNNSNMGDGADAADFDHDGIPNLMEYALGLHPAQSAAGQLPPPVRDGGNFGLSFTEPGGISGITYGAEWSPSLSGGSWLPVTDTGSAPQHLFNVPVGTNKQMFMRLTVTPSPSP